MGIKINLDIAHVFAGIQGTDELFDEFVVYSPETIDDDIGDAVWNMKKRIIRELKCNPSTKIVWAQFPCSWNHSRCTEEFRRILNA